MRLRTFLLDDTSLGLQAGLLQEIRMQANGVKAMNETRGMNAILVFNEPALLRKNRIIDKLGQRGVDVLRTYEASGVVPASAMTDASMVIMQAASVTEGQLSKWKAYADANGARFFRIPHQTSMPEWRALEDWVARALADAAPRSHREKLLVDSEQVVKAEKTASEERAGRLRAEAELEEWRSKVNDLNAQLARLKRAEPEWNSQTATLLKERDGLREQLAGVEERANRINKTMIENARRAEETIRSLREANEALTRGQSKLKDERDQAIQAARNAKTAPPPELQLPEWLTFKVDPMLIKKLDAAVKDGILDAAEACEKFMKKVLGGGA